MDTEPTYRYKAFISYSHRDEKWASWLHRAIETYRVPKYLVGQQTAMGVIPARTAPVFRDRDELASATDLNAKLRDALDGSACLVVICSPAAAASRWVNEEILCFKRLGRGDRVFALIADGEPYASRMPGREQEECFPPALRFQLGEDGKLSDVPAEPIAADARENKDGKTNAQIKLLAGMLGVGFDALRQREQQRRQRHLAIIAASSMAGMVVTIGLATTAVIARNEAERHRARAEKEAETARKVSGFMAGLFRITDPSEARGKSITAVEILTSGAHRIDTELAGEPAVQAELMDTIGTVYASLGLFDDARGMLRRALEKRRGLEGVDAGVIARNQVALADVLTAKAEIDEAEKLYKDAISSLEPRQSERQAAEQLAAALSGLGEVYFQAGRHAEAEPLHQRVLELRRAHLPPGDAEIADAIANIGLNQWDQGNAERAEELLRASLAMRRAALGSKPHPELASHLNNLALLLMEEGNFDEAEQLYREAMDMNYALYAGAHPDIATGLNNLGLLFRQKGDLAQAEDNYRRAMEMQRELLGNAHPDVARALNNLAFVLYDKGDVAEAVATQRKALELRRKTLGEKHVDTANSMTALARWLGDTDAIDEAELLGRKSLALLTEIQGADHGDTAMAELGLAQVLLRTPRLDEARSLAGSATRKLEAAYGGGDWMVAYGKIIQGSTLASAGDNYAAADLLTSGYKELTGNAGTGRAYLRKARQYLIAFYEATGQQALAADLRAEQPAPETP